MPENVAFAQRCFARSRAKGDGQRGERCVGGVFAELLGELIEIVEAQMDKRQRLFVAARSRDFFPDALVERLGVVEAGCGISMSRRAETS